jgi:hypothetical protein
MIYGELDIKARLVAEGMKRFDRREGLDTSTAMPHVRALRFLCAWITQRGDFGPEDILQADVKNAFLQSPSLSKVPVVVSAPREMPDLFGVTGLAVLKQSLYGTREAGRNWEVHLRNILLGLGYAPCQSHQGVYIRRVARDDVYEIDGVLYVHVDDFLAFSGRTKARVLMDEVSSKMEFKTQAKPIHRFTGFDVHVSVDGVFMNQELLASSLDVKACESKRTPFYPLPLNLAREEDAIEASPSVSKQSHRRYRSLLGSLSYLQHTRLDLLFALSFFGRYANRPTEYALRLLEHTCMYAKSTASLGLVFPSRVGRAKGIRNGSVFADISTPPSIDTPWVIDCRIDTYTGTIHM